MWCARMPTTGLLHRRELIEALAARLESPTPGGMRCVALIRVDKFATIERDVGVSASEEVLAEFANVLKETLHSKEVVGRFGGTRFLALLERGNEHDIEAWGEQLIARVQKHVMRVKDKTISLTCTVGFSVVPPGRLQLDALVADAIEASVARATPAAAIRPSHPIARTTTTGCSPTTRCG